MLFGKQSNQHHAALFLKYLLDYIRGWAELFPTYDAIHNMSPETVRESESVRRYSDSANQTDYVFTY